MQAVLKYSELQQSQKVATMAPFHSLSHHLPKDKQHLQSNHNVIRSTISHHCYELYCCDDESPVFVTLLDLEGYNKEVEEGYLMQRDELQGNAGLVCKMGVMTAKSVVSVAKASAALARLSYIWLGYQRQNQAIFSRDQALFSITSECNTASNSSISDTNEQAHPPIISVPICQQGLVEC